MLRSEAGHFPGSLVAAVAAATAATAATDAAASAATSAAVVAARRRRRWGIGLPRLPPLRRTHPPSNEHPNKTWHSFVQYFKGM